MPSTAEEAPIKVNTSPANMKPTTDTMQAPIKRNMSSWPAVLLAFSANLAPVYWDTRDMPAIPNPALNEMKRNIIGHEIDGAATASDPSFPNQKASVKL